MPSEPDTFAGTQPPSHPVLRPVHLHVNSPKNHPAVQTALSPSRPGLPGPPLASSAGDATADASHPLPTSQASAPASSRQTFLGPRACSSVAAVAGRIGWSVRTKRPSSPTFSCSLQFPHCPGRNAQFPRSGRPQAAESGRAFARATGLGGFSETFFPYLSSLLRIKRAAKAFFPPYTRTLPPPERCRDLSEVGDPLRVRGPSGAAARSHP